MQGPSRALSGSALGLVIPVALAAGALSSAPALGAAVARTASVVGPRAPRQEQQTAIRLADVTATAGIDFVHHDGARGEMHMPESTPGGTAWVDYDGDGRWDLYFVDSGELPMPGNRGTASPGSEAVNVLYRNLGGVRFRRAAAGVAGTGYGMGASAADYDGDGWVDLYVTNYGRDTLYRNNGDGTFTDVTGRAGFTEEDWTTGAAWGDLDGDALPELYVARYVEYDPVNRPRCYTPDTGQEDICHPTLFNSTSDLLYANRGDGTFAEVAASTGIEAGGVGKGLGVMMIDHDDDGDLDIYVANDTTRNFLHENLGGMRFEEVGVFTGVAVGNNGEPQAGMGLEFQDLDGDLVPELLVTNFENERYNLYERVGPGFWMDRAHASDFGRDTFAPLGFGIVAVDLDADGDRDVVIANGHILTRSPDFAQPNQVFENTDTGRLVDVSEQVGPAITRRRSSRGLAPADFDGDGMPDLVVTNVGGPAELLANRASPRSRLVLRLRGRRTVRDALGARVTVHTDQGAQRALVHGAASYLSQGATDVYVGLGDAGEADVEITWPDGTVEQLGTIAPDHLYLIFQDRGIVARRELAPGSASD